MSENPTLDEFTNSSTSEKMVDTPVGKLPGDWAVEWLEDVTTINPDGFSEDNWDKDTFEYISLSQASEGRISGSKTTLIGEAPSRAQRHIQYGDVLVGTVRPKQASHAFVPEEHAGKICSSGFGVLRTGPNLNSRYLIQEILSNRFFSQMEAYVAGSGYPAIKISDLRKHRVAIPPLAEQRKIATVLYTADKAINKAEDIIQRLQRVKEGYLQDNLIDKIGKSQSPTELGELPEGWEKMNVGSVASDEEDSLVDGPFGSSLKSEEFVDDGYARVIQLKNVREARYVDDNIQYVTREKYDELERHSAKPGDVYIAKMASPVARACILPDDYEHYMMGCADVVKLEPSDEFVDEFVMYCLNSHPIWKQAAAHIRGSGRQRINLNQLKEIDLPKPPIDEQRRIVDGLNSIVSSMDIHQEQREKTQRLKRGLVQDLLSGTVRTTNTNIEVPDEIAQHG